MIKDLFIPQWLKLKNLLKLEDIIEAPVFHQNRAYLGIHHKSQNKLRLLRRRRMKHNV